MHDNLDVAHINIYMENSASDRSRADRSSDAPQMKKKSFFQGDNDMDANESG